ncbi:MAG: endolytic transglycosylase MltG [Lachnospiraceae bacterium]|nr:endolytic transglycosylase MltG [Lachnospiraceae bacterium]
MRMKTAATSIIGVVMRILIALLVIVFIYRGAMYCYDFGYRIFTDKPMSIEPGRDVTVIINEGYSSKQIGEILEENGLINDALLFVLQEKLSEYSGEIKSGVYTLNTSMNTEKMIAIMSGNYQEEEEEKQ